MQATTNVVVDLKRVLSGVSTDQLVDELGATQGVARVRVSSRTRRLVLVDYDPRVTDSRTILHAVVSHGYDACLVGM